MTDDEISSLRKSGEYFTRSVQLGRRGAGSIFIEFHETGLVTLSHRVREDGKKRQKKLGFHASCFADLSLEYPDAAFITLDQAAALAEKHCSQRQSVDSFKTVFESEKANSKRQKRGYASFGQMLISYETSLVGRPSYEDAKSAFKCHLFEKMPDGKNLRYARLLDMNARDVRPDDIMPVISRVMHVKKKKTICNSLIAYISASATWAKNYDSDVRIKPEDRLPEAFGIEFNYFKGMKKYRELTKKGKYQLSDKQLWLLWHNACQCMGKSGYLARLLIAIGGVRQEHLLATAWNDVDLDFRYPNILMTSHKGADFEPYLYASVLNDLALEEVKRIQLVHGHRKNLFPIDQKKLTDGREDRPMRGDAFDKPFKRLREHVKEQYDYEMPHLTMGMIRGTISTRMAAAGVPDHLKEMIQGHNQSNIRTLHYDRFKHLAKKAEWLKVWNDYLLGLFNRTYEFVSDIYPEDEIS